MFFRSYSHVVLLMTSSLAAALHLLRLRVLPPGEGLQNSAGFISPRPVVQVWSVFSNRSYLQQPRAMAVACIALGVLDFLDQQLEGICTLSGNRVFVKSMALAQQLYSSCGVTPLLCKHIE